MRTVLESARLFPRENQDTIPNGDFGGSVEAYQAMRNVERAGKVCNNFSFYA